MGHFHGRNIDRFFLLENLSKVQYQAVNMFTPKCIMNQSFFFYAGQQNQEDREML